MRCDWSMNDYGLRVQCPGVDGDTVADIVRSGPVDLPASVDDVPPWRVLQCYIISNQHAGYLSQSGEWNVQGSYQGSWDYYRWPLCWQLLQVSSPPFCILHQSLRMEAEFQTGVMIKVAHVAPNIAKCILRIVEYVRWWSASGRVLDECFADWSV